jgi:HEXXH motif-containing protein
MVWPYGIHRLSETDVGALAVGEFPVEMVQVLRAAQLSKHTLLLEAVRRTISQPSHYDGADLVEKAIRTLSEVQARAPEVVADVLRLPHFGFWAARCLSLLRSGARQELGSAWFREIGHLATFAAVSALRIGYPFDLTVPAHHGRIAFPAFGTALVGRPGGSGWARVRLDRWGATASGARTVRLPVGDEPGRRGIDPAWRPAVRLETEAGGIRLSVVLETSDPFLRHLSPAAIPHSQPVGIVWQRRLEEAWQILVNCDRTAAAALADVVTTLVPLEEPKTGDLISATSGWAWGAIAMSLPADASIVAETLDHEFYHLILAAVEDLTPLVYEDDGALYYAPWRNDPRPASVLIQGIYAHFGVAGFWRQQRRHELAANRFRSELRFTRAHRAALDTARALADTDVLTMTGRVLAAGMLNRLEAWLCEKVPDTAAAAAAEIGLEHRLRWRLAHCHPDATAIDALAQAWLARGRPELAWSEPSVTVIPYQHRLSSDLPALLELRYQDPLKFDRAINSKDSARRYDIALVNGDYQTARDGYVELVRSRGDRAAWVGLLLSRYRIAGAPEPAGAQPEIIAGVHDRIRELTGLPPDAESLIAWLNTMVTQAK